MSGDLNAERHVPTNSSSLEGAAGDLIPVDPFYDRGYHGIHHRNLIEEDDYYRSRAETALRYWAHHEKSLRIFDYGCGVGQSIALLPNAEGWDVSAEARQVCRSHGLRVYETISEVPRRAYDRILCRHVLEHLEQPLDALRSMRELLAPDGELLLILPRDEHWLPLSAEPDINQHLYCWTPRTIYNLLWRASYRPLSVHFEYPFGQHALLPLRRLIGARIYHSAISVASRLFRRNGELVIRASPLSY